MSFKDDLEKIARLAGVKKPVLEQYGRTSTDSVTIYLRDDDDEVEDVEPLEVALEVEYSVEPTEYEGPHVFYKSFILSNF